MNELDYRAWRVHLRQVTSALQAEALAEGAVGEQTGVMDVLRFPRQPARSYTTPRHGTVWVPDVQVRAALNEMTASGCPARLRLLDGLYPPQFVSALRALGLTLLDERPLLLLPLDTAPPDDRLGAWLVQDETATADWRAITGIRDSAPHSAQDWLLGLDNEVLAGVRLGAAGGRAARLLAWRGPDNNVELAFSLLAAAAGSAGVDLLFAEADGDSGLNAGKLRALGFRDCGAILTFEAAP